MPYIKDEARKRLVIGMLPENAGELNYCFSILIAYYLGDTFNYQKINDVMGALEGAKLEAYRRLAAPYEDKKLMENGDVYV